ncbi:hypothetical protein LWE61_13445, partial [Sphingobium sufflavum]|nr:hypothetical protein [Sphingobium sufflavum]
MTAISEADIRSLGQSGMFDAEWYQATYPDVALLGMAPAEHYLWLGRRLGRPGRPRSDSLKSGAAIRAVSGQAENGRIAGDGADILALARWSGFDPAYVCKQLAIAESRDREKVAKYYYERSRSLNISPNPLFDPEYYRQANKLSFKDDMVQHYLSGGAAEQLRTHRLFDHEWYKSQVPSAISSRDLVAHYWEHGYPQRILPVDPEKVTILPEVVQAFFSGAEGGSINDFDPVFCRSYNPDLAHLGDVELREHYERHGRSEKRVASLAVLLAESKTLGRFVPLDFDPEEYIALHADLELAFQDRPWGSLNHYLSGGMSEARTYCEAQLYGHLDADAHNLLVERKSVRRALPIAHEDMARNGKPASTDEAIVADATAKAFTSADILALARWSGFDPAYVCKQLAIAESRDREKVAKHYYERSRSLNISPNPLFDPEYYRQANKLSFKDDMVQHYLSGGAAEQLRTHRLFDHEWYKSQVPSAISSRDLVAHYWEHGYPQRILPVDPEKVTILPEVVQAFFSGAEGGSINDFDPVFCRSYNPDLAHLGDVELREHYERHGRSEKRVASLAVLLAESKTLGRFVPLDFDPEEYIALHADLELAFQDRPWGSLNHYLSGGMSEARTYCEAQLYG